MDFGINFYDHIFVQGITILCFIGVWIFNKFRNQNEKLKKQIDITLLSAIAIFTISFVIIIFSNSKTSSKTTNFSVRPNLTQFFSELRLQEFQSYINPNVIYSTDKPNVAVLFESPNSNSNVSPEHELGPLLKSKKYHIINNLFNNEAVISKRFVKDFFMGKTDVLIQSGIMAHLDHLVIGKLQYSFRKSQAYNISTISCDIELIYATLDVKGRIARTRSLRMIGAGSSNDIALRRGLEKLAEHANQIL